MQTLLLCFAHSSREGDQAGGSRMSAPLPQPLTEYFRASNEHDVAALLASFAVEATVEDEGKEYRGPVAIRVDRGDDQEVRLHRRGDGFSRRGREDRGYRTS